MKSNYFIPIIVVIGLAILLFFPEPETNFIAYIGTALFFVILIITLIVWNKGKE